MSSAEGLRRTLLFTHRWLGIAGGALFLLWFLSGIVMFFARMPGGRDGDRWRRLPDLDLTTARTTPAEAARAARPEPERVTVGMLGARPVYRFPGGAGWTTVFADDGQQLTSLDDDVAMRLVSGLFPEHAATARHRRHLERADQWTLQSHAFLPAHQIALGDAADTWVYLSERTGDAFLTASSSERRWAYLGAVPHWLYFTPLRRNGPLWSGVVVWLSLAGAVLALSGLAGGLWQAARSSRRGGGPTPYLGLMRWHHYAGLVFGLFTFTWVLSGCLSMEPWGLTPSTEPSAAQAAAVAGGPLALDAITLDGLRRAHQALAADGPVKELELVQFRGEPYLLALGAPSRAAAELAPAPRLVSALHPERGTFAHFTAADLTAAAGAAMPAPHLVDASLLDRHDDYYYDLHGAAPLPVLRARFDDAARTWLYLDATSGRIARREQRLSRLNRWLYHGLHSFDFPFLREHAGWRGTLIVVLSLGGLVVAATSIADGWRRVVRVLRRSRS